LDAVSVAECLLHVGLGRCDHRSVVFEVHIVELLQQLGDERYVPGIVGHAGSSEQLATLGRQAELVVDVFDDAEPDQQCRGGRESGRVRPRTGRSEPVQCPEHL
jgi:hypothetical protein